MQGTARPQSHVRGLIWVWAGVAVVLAVLGMALNAIFPELVERPDYEDGFTVVLPPERLFTVGGLQVTNTLLSAWAATLLLIGIFLTARLLARAGHPGFLEATQALLHSFLRFVESMVGERMAGPLFVLSCSALLFIVANAWIALLPVYGSIFVTTTDGHTVPLLRGAGTDVNLPLAMSLFAGFGIQVFGLVALRWDYVERFLRTRRLRQREWVPGVVDLIGGLFDLFVELTRLLSFTFRLFGSLTAGEILILAVGFLAPLIIVVPFYGLELLIGGVQAYIFGSLFAVFAAVAMSPEREEAAE